MFHFASKTFSLITRGHEEKFRVIASEEALEEHPFLLQLQAWNQECRSFLPVSERCAEAHYHTLESLYADLATFPGSLQLV